jgi:3-oxoacyl-[acyl-carrier-protein] synthase III
LPGRKRSAKSSVYVRATGFHFPDRWIASTELIRQERPGLLIAEQVRNQIGCLVVRLAGPEDTPSTLASQASKNALAFAELQPSDLDLLISIACTPADMDMWSMPAKIAQLLGANGAECFGIGDVGCAGAFAAIRAAIPMMSAPEGPERVLIAAGHVTPGHHFFPPATIFGDGAGAMVLERMRDDGDRAKPAPRVVRADLYSFSHLIDAFNAGAGLNLLRKEGRLEPHWWSVGVRDHTRYSELRTTNFDLGAGALQRSLEKARWSVDDLTWLIADNVSAKVGLAVADRVKLPFAKVFTENCWRFGHAYTADLFVNLATLFALHAPKPGQKIACVGMGLGQHWGVLLLEV